MEPKILRIDRKHTLRLLDGKAITIKIPAGMTQVTLLCDVPDVDVSPSDNFAKVCDVFFNGRPAS